MNIVDALMGMGKTSSMIRHINEADEDTRFLYITPYLTEVQRIIEKCPKRKFQQPSEKMGTKLRGIKLLFERGVNIVSTHSLFRYFDEEIIDLAYNNNYVLIMDEVADVVENLPISKDDLAVLLNEYCDPVKDEAVGEVLKWREDKVGYTGKFDEYKKMIDLGCVGIYNGNVVLWLFPISTFKGFWEIYILTYIFRAQVQKYYFDFHKVEYRNLYIEGNGIDGDNPYRLTVEPQEYDYSKYAGLIEILENDKINQIGDIDNALSKRWYERNANNPLIESLKKNTYNFFKCYAKTPANLNMWTTFKDTSESLKGKGYAKGFVSCNMRATNDFKERVSVAYLLNRYLDPYIKNFFIHNGVKVDEDAYALSEMIQWIFRSAIRDGQKIYAYIPSKRMRTILKSWLEYIATTKKEIEV